MAICFKRKKDGETIKIPCNQGLNLLGHAQLETLHIGSECGGHGICGMDRIQIDLKDQKSFSPPTEAERQHLGEKLLSEGWRLGCQCFPAEDDLDLEVKFFV